MCESCRSHPYWASRISLDKYWKPTKIVNLYPHSKSTGWNICYIEYSYSRFKHFVFQIEFYNMYELITVNTFAYHATDLVIKRYKVSLMMARFVCWNMWENWQSVKNIFSACKFGSTNCHMTHSTYNIKISNLSLCLLSSKLWSLCFVT